ncbi:hypothetical protein FHR55_000673 [Xanthomonas arboricola]
MNEQSGNSGQLQARDAIAAFLLERDEALEPGEANDGERLGSADEILAIIAARQPVGQEPVYWQSRFSGGVWGYCTREHHDMVKACPQEWPDYEVRPLYTAPPAPAAVPVEGMPAACKHCDGRAFEWFPHCRAASDVQDGRLRAHDVRFDFVLGCLDCSETLMIVPADRIAATLATHPQPAAACVNINAMRYLYLRAQPVEGGPWGTPRIAIPSCERAGQFANCEDADAAIDAAIAAQHAHGGDA